MLIEYHIHHRTDRERMTYSTSVKSETFAIILLFASFMTSTALNIDCNHPPQLVDPQTCCTDGGRDEISERCARRFGITASPTQGPPSADIATCLAECVLTESKYLVGQTINIATIRMDLQRKFPQDPTFVETMTRSYQKCIPIAQRKMEELRRTPQGVAALAKKCSPFSGILLGCTYTEYFQNCPAAHWTASEQCQIAKQFLQKCAVF